MLNIHEQARDIHRRNYKWWHDKGGNRLERNRGELLMLVVSELAEAMEALRKDLWDDKLPHRKGEEVELADAYIRLLDYAEGFECDIRTNAIQIYNDWYGENDNKAEDLLCIVGEIWCAYTDVDVNDEQWRISCAIGAIMGYCRHYGLDLQGAVSEKLAYNDTRLDHTWEAREAVGGKKF